MGVYVRFPDGSMHWDESRADPNDNGGSVIDSGTGKAIPGADRQSGPTGPGGNGPVGSQANPYGTYQGGPSPTNPSSPFGAYGNLPSGAKVNTFAAPSTSTAPLASAAQGANALTAASAPATAVNAAGTNAAPAAQSNNFTFDPANADRAFRAGLQANGLDLLNPNGAAGTYLRRAGDLQRLFPLLTAIFPGTYGNGNSVTDAQNFFTGLPGNFESLIRTDPNSIISQLFSNHDATSPLGQLQLYLGNTPDELANVLGAVYGLGSSPYASNFFGNYLRNLVSGANSNAGLLNSHGGNLLGAVQQLLGGVKTFQ